MSEGEEWERKDMEQMHKSLTDPEEKAKARLRTKRELVVEEKKAEVGL